MEANIIVIKSFDSGTLYHKKVEVGDFETFFKDEGKYIDRLLTTLKENGKDGDSFEITYNVTVIKSKED